MAKPVIAISMGDPGGIGPEVSLKASISPSVRKVCTPLLIGQFDILKPLAKKFARDWRVVRVSSASEIRGDVVGVLDTGGCAGRIVTGQSSRTGGLIAGRAIEKAVELALNHEVTGIVTAPVSKKSLYLAGYGMVGHTELISKLTATKHYAMMMVAGKTRIIFATTHLPIREISAHLDKKTLVTKIVLAHRYLALYLGIKKPKLAICCLNPHCGEGGGLGTEEVRVIKPAAKICRRKGIAIDGPFPADSIFERDTARQFDGIIAMYHDQGMIPVKIRGLNRVVNVTIGIPIVRTSPGHGTAFDIAGKGVASEDGMVQAVLECKRIVKRLKHANRI